MCLLFLDCFKEFFGLRRIFAWDIYVGRGLTLKVVKKINNNVAVCLDGRGNELVAFGKGIGFPPVPYELTDLSVIRMTFYRMDEHCYKLLNEIPEQIFDISTQIVARAFRELTENLNPNIIFSLADHIHFAIERVKSNKQIKMLFSYDIEQLYPKETAMGRYAVALVREKMYVTLPEAEITNIAMHFINAAAETVSDEQTDKVEEIIEEVGVMIENFFGIQLKRDEFNYNRFVMHLRYYIKRIQEGKQFMDNCDDLMNIMKEERPQVYECARQAGDYIAGRLQAVCTEDEVMYLLVHINRIIAK